MSTTHSGRHSFLIYQLDLPLLLGSLIKKRKKTIEFPIKLRKNQDIGWKKGTKKFVPLYLEKNIPKILSLEYFSYSGVFLKKISFLNMFSGLLTEVFQAAAIRIAFTCCISVLLAPGTVVVCNYYTYFPLSILNICM